MEVIHPVVGLVYGAMCLVYILFIEEREHKYLKPFFKIVPLLILYMNMLMILLRYNAPFTIKDTAYEDGLSTVAWGLFFSMIGDLYTNYKHLFVYGLASFSVTQGFYTLLFSRNLERLLRISVVDVVTLLAISVVSLCLYVYLVSKMACAIRVPALVYTILLTIMAWTAVCHIHDGLATKNVLTAVGASLFYASDVCLSLNKWAGPNRTANTLIMPLYYTAQFCIVYSSTIYANL